MKIFKITDCFIQLLLLAIAVGYLIGGHLPLDVLGNGYLFDCYGAVGAWQLMSALIHAINPQYNRKKLRRFYVYALLIVAVLGVLTFFVDHGIFYIEYLMGMLFLAPALALYYSLVCIAETRSIKTLPLLHSNTSEANT